MKIVVIYTIMKLSLTVNFSGLSHRAEVGC